MIRKLMFLLLMLVLAQPMQAAVSFVQNANVVDDTNDATMTVTVNSTTPGNLLVLFVKWEGATTTVEATEGATGFTSATVNNHDGNMDLSAAFAYKLVASGSDTSIDVTLGASRPFKVAHAWEFSYTGTASLDVEIASSEGANGVTSTTGSFSPTSDSQLVMAGVGIYDSPALDSASADINGVDAEQVEPTIGTTMSTHSWARTNVGAFTGTGVAAWDGSGLSRDWVSNGISFAFTGGGGPAAKGRLQLLGAGK